MTPQRTAKSALEIFTSRLNALRLLMTSFPDWQASSTCAKHAMTPSGVHACFSTPRARKMRSTSFRYSSKSYWTADGSSPAFIPTDPTTSIARKATSRPKVSSFFFVSAKTLNNSCRFTVLPLSAIRSVDSSSVSSLDPGFTPCWRRHAWADVLSSRRLKEV